MSVMQRPSFRREEHDDGPEFPIQALPARMAPHARTNSRSSNNGRASSRQSKRSKRDSSSPAPLSRGMSNGRYSPAHSLESGEILSSSDSVSMMDPRRFTPSLHASLVAEILSLRRDLDSKNGVLDHLESTLHETKIELETKSTDLTKTNKELRSLGRQLQLLEGGTSSALSELSKERDEAVERISDFQRRLDASQRRTQMQEADNDRLQIEIEKKQQLWDNERRQSDREKHILQARLKTVVDEVAAHQRAMHPLEKPQAIESDEYAGDSGLGMESDTGSSRSGSPKTQRKTVKPESRPESPEQTRARRFSKDSIVDLTTMSGLSLADELNFTETGTDEEGSEEDDVGALSNFTTKQKRSSSALPGRISRQSHIRQGSESLVTVHEPVKRTYTDIGIQLSRPTSPDVRTESSSTPTQHTVIFPPEFSLQCRKCGHNFKDPVPADDTPPGQDAAPSPPAAETLSSFTQTDPEPRPLSEGKPISIFLEPTRTPMTNSATQTIDEDLDFTPRPSTPPQVPMIRLHPPASPGPSRPVSTVLPPLHRNAATQADLIVPRETSSVAVQTEEIRVDLRLNKLPPHLQPSAITSKPGTPEPGEKSKPVARRRALGSRAIDSMDLNKAGVNDSSMASKVKENLRTTCHWSDGEADEYEVSDDPPMKGAVKSPKSPRTRAGMARRQNRFSGGRAAGSKTGKQDISELAKQLEEVFQSNPGGPLDQRSPKNRAVRRHAHSGSIHRANSFKRNVIIKGHKRDKSGAEGQDPPYPVPLRASSRRLPLASSDGARSPTRSSKHPSRRGYNNRFMPDRNASLRKVQSAAAIARRQQRTIAERSPSPVASSTVGSTVTQAQSDLGHQAPAGFAAKVEGWKQRNGATFPPPPVPSLDRSTFRSSASIKSRQTPTSSNFPSSSRYDHVVNQNRFSQQSSAFSSAAVTDTVSSSVYGSNRPTSTVVTGNSNSMAIQSPSRASEASGNVASPGGISVADAIAHTMVGEWLYKYTRRRKSFGVNTDKDDTDGGEAGAGVGSGGQRHKRWVWLAPYERAVLWSSKQPVGNTAVLGKSSRKLQISNVIDVADNGPTPKGCPDRLFDRSILVLTPNRALKFTAPTIERHHIWLTALSFLSHAPNGSSDLLALPSPSGHNFDYATDSTAVISPTTPASATPVNAPMNMAGIPSIVAAAQQPPVKTRRPVRDSIRLAKAKVREPFSHMNNSSNTVTSASTNAGSGLGDVAKLPSHAERGENRISMASSFASATPPPIARYPPLPDSLLEKRHHYRKRSNTAGRVPLSSGTRSFSHNNMGTAAAEQAAPVESEAAAGASGMGAGSRAFGTRVAGNAPTVTSLASSEQSSGGRGDPYSRPYRSAFPSATPAAAPAPLNTNVQQTYTYRPQNPNHYAMPQLPPVPSIPTNFFDALPPAGGGAGNNTMRMNAFVGSTPSVTSIGEGGVGHSPTYSESASLALEREDEFPDVAGGYSQNGRNYDREKDARVLGINRSVVAGRVGGAGPLGVSSAGMYKWGERKSSVGSGGSAAGELFRGF